MQGGDPRGRESAQRRADRIRAFREELDDLASEGILELPADARERLRLHHEALLERFAARFDVDRTEAEKRLSIGMRVAALLGALAFVAAVVSFFYRFWGAFPTPAQVTLLAGAPLLSLAGMEVAARRERSLYVTGIAGLVAVASFVLNLSVLFGVFAVRFTPWAFLAWALLAGALAYAYGIRLLLLAALASFTVFFAALPCSWAGSHWPVFSMRPELYLVPGVLMLVLSRARANRALPEFPPVYRAVGVIALGIPIFVLSGWKGWSYLGFETGTVEAIYQAAGFVLAALGIWAGVRFGWREVENLATGFFVLFLFARLVDWFWDWIPKWLFFLLLGALAVAVLLALRRFRSRPRRAEP